MGSPPPTPTPPPSLDAVLPSILKEIDDHEPEVVLKGLIKLEEVLEKFPWREFLQKNWSLVVYDALKKVIYEKDLKVVEKLGGCLLKVLDRLEPDVKDKCEMMTRYDETLKTIFIMMELTPDLNLKKAWLRHLIKFQDQMGLAIMHWVEKLGKLLDDYVASTVDKELMVLVLKCIHSLIRNTWVKPSSHQWTQIILKILFNLGALKNLDGTQEKEEDDMTMTSQIYEDIRRCFDLMKDCDDFPEVKKEIEDCLIQVEKVKDKNFYQHEFYSEWEKCAVKL